MTLSTYSNQQQHLPSNIVVTGQPSQVDSDPRKTSLRKAIIAITGDDPKNVPQSYGQNILEMFNGVNDEVFEKTIKRVLDSYDGKTKYPHPSFWKGALNAERSAWNTFHEKKEMPKTPETERQKVARMAREWSEKFKSVEQAKKDSEKTPYELKLERYRENAKLGNVLNRETGEWLPRGEAEYNGIPFRCPIEWLSRLTEK